VGITRPSTPGGFAAVAAGNTAALTWTASTQDGTSTLAGYYIYRDGSDTAFATIGAGTTSWVDTIGWTIAHTYMIRAYNAAGRRSMRSSTLSVTTGTATLHTLTVNNTNTSSAITVWVQSTTSPFLWWIGNGGSNSASSVGKPGGYSIAKKKSNTWVALPFDTYTVSTGGGQVQTVNPAVTPSISFSN
jgi:hypothetical protein